MNSNIEKVAPLTKAAMGIKEGLPLEASAGGVEELRRDLQRMMDMEAIRQLKHAYFRCLDTANWDELVSICHKELKVHYTGGDYEFKLEGDEAFVAAMQHAFNTEAVARHNGYMPEIQMLSETEATAIWYLSDHFWSLKSDKLTHGTALYWDRYVKENGHWVISETSYQRIYQINETLAEKPDLVSHYLRDYGSEPAQ